MICFSDQDQSGEEAKTIQMQIPQINQRKMKSKPHRNKWKRKSSRSNKIKQKFHPKLQNLQSKKLQLPIAILQETHKGQKEVIYQEPHKKLNKIY